MKTRVRLTTSRPSSRVPYIENPLRHYLRMVKRQAWLILFLTSVTVGSAAAFTTQQDTLYRASMSLVVSKSGGAQGDEFGNDPLQQTMTDLVESEIVVRRVINKLDLDMSPKKFKERLIVTSTPSTSLLGVSFDDTDPNRAATVLGDVASAFINRVATILGVRAANEPTPRGVQSAPVVFVRVFDPPHVAPDPVAPRPVRTMGFAAALGLALALGLAFARETLDNRIRSRREAEEAFGAPVIGTLPKGMRGKSPPGIAGSRLGRRPALLEHLQLLRANFQFSQAGSNTTILVTSALPQEGKTTVVANLSVALAASGSRVVCVEADLRRPRLLSYLGVQAHEYGLAEVMEEHVDLEDALHTVRVSSHALDADRKQRRKDPDAPPETTTDAGTLQVLGAGQSAANPSVFLTADRVENLASQLRLHADYVIFDAPPLLLVPDSFPLVLTLDCTLLVARQGKTTRDEASATRATLESLGARNVSVVLTDVPTRESYGYGYASTAAPARVRGNGFTSRLR